MEMALKEWQDIERLILQKEFSQSDLERLIKLTMIPTQEYISNQKKKATEEFEKEVGEFNDQISFIDECLAELNKAD